MWDIENTVQHAVLIRHYNYVWKVFITYDEKFIVSASFSDGIRVWSIQPKKQFHDLGYG